MMHVDDWLDNYVPQTEGEKFANEWLEHFRRPAVEKDHPWLAQNALYCTYKDGKRYRCIGCSRMGDVWLTHDYSRVNGYDMRIDISDCSQWARTAVPEPLDANGAGK